MNRAYSRLKKKLRWLNIRAYTWEEVNQILKRERIRLSSYPMCDEMKGYYSNELRNVYRKRVIVLNSKLSEFEKLFVVLHELVHHFLHVTGKKRHIFNWHIAKLNDSKEDKEADTLSLILAIPQKDLLEMEQMPADDINSFYAEKLALRKTVYHDFDKKLNEI